MIVNELSRGSAKKTPKALLIYIYIYIYMCVYVCVCVCVCESVSVSVCVAHKHTRTHARTHIHTHQTPYARTMSWWREIRVSNFSFITIYHLDRYNRQHVLSKICYLLTIVNIFRITSQIPLPYWRYLST